MATNHKRSIGQLNEIIVPNKALTKTFLTCLCFILTFFSPIVAKTKKSNDPEGLQWAYKDIRLPQAWDYTIGSSDVTVAVIDNGFDQSHLELRDNIWKNNDEVPNDKKDNDNNGYIDDIYGWNFTVDKDSKIANIPDPYFSTSTKNKTIHHGTVVAGLLGAKGGNNLAGTGVNWNIKLMNLKIVDSVSGKGGVDPLSEAIRYAVDNGADIISFSIEGVVPGERQINEIKEAIDYAYRNRVAMFASSGNKFKNLNKESVYPVCADENSSAQKILGVSAMQKSHRISLFSNIGSECVDVTAPGSSISSTMVYNPKKGLDKKYGGSWKGTSFAAPLVSGIGALIKTLRPRWSPPRIYDAILENTYEHDDDKAELYKNLFGAGLVNAKKAVESSLIGVVSNFPIKGLLAVDGNLNIVDKKIFATSTKIHNFEQRSIKYISAVKHSYKSNYILANDEEGKTKITLLGDKQNSFYVNKIDNIDIRVGDIDGDFQDEVIISPKKSDSVVFTVYSLQGKKEFEYIIDKNHSGASISVLKRGERENLAVLFSQFGRLKVVQFNHSFEPETSFDINFMRNSGNLETGDIDGDGVHEYVVSNSKGNGLLSYYDTDGSIQKTFFAYGYLEKGFKTGLVDIDSDGRDELVTIPFGLNDPIKFWENNILIDEWSVHNKAKNNSFIIPIK